MRNGIAEWHRKQIPFSLILIDIDHFKKFNDTHGHQVGDEVLRHVAQNLVLQCREMDRPCRYGGEEFAVVLPATQLTAARFVAERIRRAIEQSVTKCDSKKLKVTASVGLAGVQPHDDSNRLIRRADEALYASKKAGRNCGHWRDSHACYPLSDPPAKASPADAVAALSSPSPGLPAIVGPGLLATVLETRVDESQRLGIPLSVLYLKIEEYGSICRLYGPAIGRNALAAATKALSKCLRDRDVLAGVENGEFAVLLFGSTAFDAHQLANVHVARLLSGPRD